MKHISAVTLFLALLSTAAWGGGFVKCYREFSGTATVSMSGISGVIGNGTDTMNFATGPLVSGSLSGGGAFSSSGSNLTIAHSTVFLFSGILVGDSTWTLISRYRSKSVFHLEGEVYGHTQSGRFFYGVTNETIVVTPTGAAITEGHTCYGEP